MKKFIKNKKDRLILIFNGVLALLCIYFINYPHLLIGKLGSSRESIGQIIQMEKDVRTKFSDTYFWSEAYNNASIASGESLFTGDKSSTMIELKDGKKIRISENSLVKFNFSNDEIVLDFTFGEISAAGLNKKIKVLICDKTYEIDPEKATEFVIKKGEECGKLNVRVKKGQVKVNDRKVTTKIEYDEKPKTSLSQMQVTPPIETRKPIEVAKPIEIPPAPVIEEGPLPAPILADLNLKHRLTSQKLPVINWFDVENANGYQVEISQQKNFSSPLVISTQNTSIEAPELPKVRTYYRARAISNKGVPGLYSDIGEIGLVYPKITLENEYLSSPYQAKNSKDFGEPKKFDVAWSPVPNIDHYIVEVSRTKDFSKVAKIKSRSPASTLNVPRTGEYHWRVSALSKSGKTLSQSEKAGLIDYSREFNISKPLIDERYRDASYYFQKTAARFIWIGWDPSKIEQAKYKVELSQKADFKEVDKTYSSQKSDLLIREQLSAGIYYWRVRLEVDGKHSDWSDVGQFNIQTGSRKAASEPKQK